MRLPALILALWCAVVPGWSQSMPEFGASVTFPKGEEPVTVAGLRGKVAVVLFFQSWCPICNGRGRLTGSRCWSNRKMATTNLSLRQESKVR